MSQNTENGVKSLGSIEPVLCASDLSAKANHLASYDSSSGLALTNAVNDQIAFLIVNGGISADHADARPWVPGGIYKVWVSATVANAAVLQLDAATPGQLVTQTTGHAVAQAMEAVTGAGIIKVRALAVQPSAKGQPAPTAYNTTATITAADLVDGIITSTTAAAVAGTTPTGTLLTAAFPHVNIGGFADFSVINTGGTNAFTLTAGTDVSIVGAAAVAANTSGRFRMKRTAATTWVIYRL